MQNQWPDRPKAVGGGGTLVGRGAASRLFWGVGGSNNTIVKNCRRRQSTRDEMEDEVDGDCQDNQVDNARRRGAIAIVTGSLEEIAMMPMMIVAWVTGSVLSSKANFMALSEGEYQKKKKHLRKKAETEKVPR